MKKMKGNDRFSITKVLYVDDVILFVIANAFMASKEASLQQYITLLLHACMDCWALCSTLHTSKISKISHL